ncbi:PREDICTED: occludin [Tinamus guttatus]|uniref:occludin n=1 Tax=Tinamus guttatus TaxID=94827 RepID=UPI00052F31A2|nr:PREDICTED: occludin [Tinamus guttatus]
MFSKKPYDSPPTGYGPPGTGDSGYGYSVRSPPPGSYYIEDVPQHFYKWSSPPGVIRILEAIIILLCIAIFACVASTLAWEYGYGTYGSGLSGYLGGTGYYGSGLSYGYGYGSYYSGRFYLVVIVVCAILAFIMLIASIVYIMGVNPQAQMTSSYYYSPLLALCNQVYSSGTYLNQYLYHYCTVDPQEAVAIVCGFLIVILLCLICFFAHKTRSKIWKYGKPNIYWDKIPVVQEGPNVEEWVSGSVVRTGILSIPPGAGGSILGLFPGLYPPIASDGTRQKYKQEFDSDLRRYKRLCAEMDGVNDRLAQLSKQLDTLAEESSQYQDVAEEYNRLKDSKRSAEYQAKKAESKALRNKLFHIKRMVSDYDKTRG